LRLCLLTIVEERQKLAPCRGIPEVPKYDYRRGPSRDCNFSVNASIPADGGRRRACGWRIRDPVESLLTLVNTPRTRTPAGPAEPPRLNDLVLGRYRLLERLGAGGFGVVWRATDELLHREVAVKWVALGPDGDGERASREALAAARLAHPAIVALYEACAVQDAFYLISELVHGKTLAQLLASRALSDEEVLAIGVALARALSHAHARGVIHRDIKPQNVLVPDQLDGLEPTPEGFLGAAKLTDFGGASLSGEDVLTRTGDVLGTLAYMAPEQSDGREVGEEADLYALALVLYEALSGVNPVRGATPAATARRIGRPLTPLERQRGDLPRGLTRALDTALLPVASERGTVDRLRLALEDGLEQDLRPSRVTLLRRGRPVRQAAEARSAIPEPVLAPRDRPARVHEDSVDEESSTSRTRLALPRAVWLTCGLGVVVWQGATGRPGAGLLVLAGVLPLALLPRRAGLGWLAGGLAPSLGLVGLAGAFPAIAGQAGSWRKRAALGALGYWWLTLSEPLLARHLWLGEPSGTPPRADWEGSLSSAAIHVVAPMLTLGVLLGATLWATASAILPWIVRGRSAAFDAVAATMWAATIASAAPVLDGGLSGHAAHLSPRGALLGAVVGGMIAVGARALRGPV
jgi:eukaryotic-like serine/threonine-protein kinase